jgi:hypothetical protein
MGDEQGEGLGRAALALPQTLHRRRAGGINEQLKAPHALQGQDLPR